MRQVLEALHGLQEEPQILRHLPLSGTLDASKECAKLVATRDKLAAANKEIKPPRPPLDATKVWRKFEASGFSLSGMNGLDIRTLCTSDETATHPRFIAALNSNPESFRRTLCIYGLVNSYFNRWRVMEAPEEMERLIRSALDRFSKQTPALKRWRSDHSLFSPQAASGLAEFIVGRKSDMHELLRQHYIGAATGLALSTRASAAELAAARFGQFEKSSDPATNLQFLRWMIKQLFVPGVSPGSLHSAVSKLLLSTSAERSDSFQQELRVFVQNCPVLGDPRLRENGPNWLDMQPQARERFLSWLAKEYIQFFFDTILPRNDENRRRADFWLRYYKQIKDFQVAISEEDYWKLKKNNPAKQLPLHSRITQSPTSAFLMQFTGYGKDFVIIEFSDTGNAAYIYERAEFESRNVTLRTPFFQISRHLKHEKHPNRILHQGAWEMKARYRLSTLGIMP